MRKEANVMQKRANEAPNRDKTVAIRSGIGFRSSFSGRIERIWKSTGTVRERDEFQITARHLAQKTGCLISLEDRQGGGYFEGKLNPT